MTARQFPFHAETSVTIAASRESVFELLDDHLRLASHMTKPSWMTAGSAMTITTDEAQGKAVGSKIRLAGKVLGIRLMLEELVTKRQPPTTKTWKTIGAPRLLVIGPYRMGFVLSRQENGTLLRVFIDYDLPRPVVSRWLGRPFGRAYAKWCTNRMAADAARHFHSTTLPDGR